MSSEHASEEVSLAQVLAGGGDPWPQRKRARALLTECGGFDALLRTSPEHLAARGLLERKEVSLLAAIQRIVTSQRHASLPVIGAFEALESYLRTEAERGRRAKARALLLDLRNRLQADVILSAEQVPLTFERRRGLVRACLEHRACGAILVRAMDDEAGLAGIDAAQEASEISRSLEVVGLRLLDYVLFGAREIKRVRGGPERRCVGPSARGSRSGSSS